MTDQSQTRPLTMREQVISAIRDNAGKVNMLAQDGDDWVDAIADAMVKIMEAADYDERRRTEFLQRRNRDGAEDAAGLLRGWAKAYRDTPEHRFPSDPHAEFFPVDLECAADLLSAPPKLKVPDSFRVIEKSTGEVVTDWDIIGQLTAQKIADQAYLLDRRAYEVRDGNGVVVYNIPEADRAAPDAMRNSVRREDDRLIPTYGQIPWKQLGRDVMDAMYAKRTDYEFDPSYYPGHQMLPTLNFNSLARIVDKYRWYRIASAPVPSPDGPTLIEIIRALGPPDPSDEEFEQGWAACQHAVDSVLCDAYDHYSRSTSGAIAAEPDSHP